MTARPQLRVLFFDVFGTCVAQRTPVANALCNAAKAALESGTSLINSEVRAKATKMTYEQWDEFGAQWNKDVDKFTAELKAKDSVDWHAVDAYRFKSLRKLLAELGLIMLRDEEEEEEASRNNTSTPTPNPDSEPLLSVKEGSLWTDPQLQALGLIWHRLPPWPDTCRGLDLLNTKYTTATLSNTYNKLMQTLVSHSDIPFQHVLTSDMFESFKPKPEVYLGAAEMMGVKPEECGLVAAHLFDLKGAKACGFYTIYVERPLEEKNPELRGEGIPDMHIGEDEEGFVALAERLRIEVTGK